ncbi:MAG TPA: FtsX-like permease family protein [Candidatus Aquilonibacter sp.]|nr:FtsX-like permease family protein [Candidatus Aquilonibacter sp.]
MKLPDLSELALRNLRESVLRNSLTTIGISVGVASLVAMLSLGIGLQQLASRRLMKSGLFDTIVVTSRREPRNFGRDEEHGGPPAAESRILDEPTRVELERLPNVTEANPDIRFATELRYDDKPHLTTVAALPESSRSTDAFESIQGHFFSSDTAPEAILQKSFAEELLDRAHQPAVDTNNIADLATPLLGKDLIMRYAQRETLPNAPGSAAKTDAPNNDSGLRGATDAAASYSVVSREQKLKIVGVVDLDPESMRGPTRARVFIPLKLAESLHVMQPTDLRELSTSAGNQPLYASVSVRVKDPAQISATEDAIKKMGFNTFSILDATRSLQQFFAILDLFLGIFGSLALAVASIGIVNTLVMAILERRREIGIMKAIGASDLDVQKLFFAEAGAMGILGGFVGVALGWAIGHVINLGTNIYLKRQSLPPEHFWSVPLWLVGAAILFSFIVSLLAGLYPAARAARLDPVQALRYE